MGVKDFLKIFCLVLVPITVNAEQLSLLQAYQKAQKYDALLKAAVSSNDAQMEEISKARAVFMPQARISASKGKAFTDAYTSVAPKHSEYYTNNYALTVRQTIYSKANFANYSQAFSEVAKSKAILEKEQLSLASRVTGAYLDLLLASDNIRYSDSQKKSAASQLEQANRKFAAGVGTVTEVNEAKANLDKVIAQSLEWVNALEYSKRALENVTGVYADSSFTINLDKLSLVPPNPINIDEWVELAMQKNQEIVAAQNEYLSALQEIEKNKSGHFPTLDLIASKSQSENDNNYTIGSKYVTDSISLQLNIPLYSGGYVSATVRQAIAKSEELQQMLEDKKRTVSVNVRKYFNEVLNGVARVEAHQSSVRSYEAALIGTQKGYEAGFRTNVEVLGAQEKFYLALRDLASERYKLIYNRLALKQVVGVLNEDDISEVSASLSLIQ